MERSEKLPEESQNLILEGLTEAQKAAVLATNGPVLIIAGAGSGKTRTLTHRLAYLLAQGVPPEEVLALTFTNKAAEEMARRIEKLIAYSLKRKAKGRPFIGTFHSLCARILRQEIKLLGWPSSFSIYDEDDRLAAIKDAIKELGIAKDKINPGAVAGTISRLKNDMQGPETLEEKTEFSQLVKEVFGRYEEILKRRAALDFDDLLLKTIEVFQKSPKAREKYQKRARYILVDEYQDTNKPQYLLIRLLSEKHKNLCVVGDDWQSVYMWRGADFRNILNFQKDWPEAKIFFLEENFRSTQTILDAAHEIITKNQFRTEKKLYTKNEKGAPIFITRLRNEFEEAEYVAEKILEKTSLKNTLSDFCVLYRTNAQSRALEEAFIVREIPYQLVGGFKFYKRKEIQDLVSYLRVIYNPKDLTALKRIMNVPPRGIGKITEEKILATYPSAPHQAGKEFFAILNRAKTKINQEPPSQLLKWLVEEIKYKNYLNPETHEGEMRWENVEELMGMAKRFDHLGGGKGLEEFLQAVSLLQEADEYEPAKNRVTLMTLHAAKGLEFPVIFIVGCEEGILPHERAFYSPDELEEERRLCYVGMTRAKREVYLTFAHHRLRHGDFEKNPPSRFLDEIPGHLALFVDQRISGEDEKEDEEIQLL